MWGLWNTATKDETEVGSWKSVAESETAITLDRHGGHWNAKRSWFDKRAVCSPESTASIAFRASSKVDVDQDENSWCLNLMPLVEGDFEQKQEEEDEEHSLEAR